MSDSFGQYALSGFAGFALRRAQQSKWRKAALMWRRAARWCSKNHLVDAEIDGVKFRFHLNDNVSERKLLFMPQFFDVLERDLIATMLPADGVFVDIGANAGIYSVFAAKQLSAGGKVLAIEPNPALMPRLTQNIALNGFEDKVTVIQAGVAKEVGEFTLSLDATNLGGSSLKGDESNTITIACEPLEMILNEQGISHIDFIKIDIEGAEDLALMPFFDSAPESLYPRMIIIENSDDRWRLDLAARIEQAGYSTLFTSRMNRVFVKKTEAAAKAA